MKRPFKLLSFFIYGLLITCTREPNQVFQKEAGKNFVDSLKLMSNKAQVLFYTNFLSSAVEVSDTSFLNSKAGIDTLFSFIGETQSDSCFLHSNIIPDGEVRFYKDSSLISNMQFVLNGTCKGFYIGSTKKYKLTSRGDTILLKLKNKIFERQKNYR
jgi:hypothetical protein